MKSSSKPRSPAASSRRATSAKPAAVETPRIERFIDDEERELSEAVESGTFHSRGNIAAHWDALSLAASAAAESGRTRIALRGPAADLAQLRAIAKARGIPYQTLINSILHQYAVGTLKDGS